MTHEILPKKTKLPARAALLWTLALPAAAIACEDDDASVQRVEMQQTEMQQQPAQPVGERPPPREGPDGCYIPAQRSCDCEIIEEGCTEDVGVWTTGCASCASP